MNERKKKTRSWEQSTHGEERSKTQTLLFWKGVVKFRWFLFYSIWSMSIDYITSSCATRLMCKHVLIRLLPFHTRLNSHFFNLYVISRIQMASTLYIKKSVERPCVREITNFIYMNFLLNIFFSFVGVFKNVLVDYYFIFSHLLVSSEFIFIIWSYMAWFICEHVLIFLLLFQTLLFSQLIFWYSKINSFDRKECQCVWFTFF